MPTIAIVGAGPGMGLSIAKVFGRNGFSVALLSRTRETLDRLAAELGQSGIDAAGFAADVMNRPSLGAAFAHVKERFGSVDVLEYSPASRSPAPGVTMTGPLEETVEHIEPFLEYYLYGGLAATEQRKSTSSGRVQSILTVPDERPEFHLTCSAPTRIPGRRWIEGRACPCQGAGSFSPSRARAAAPRIRSWNISVVLTWGNGSRGSGTPSAVQRGPHPSPGCQSINFADGTVSRTLWL
jgi:hypothetical protein